MSTPTKGAGRVVTLVNVACGITNGAVLGWVAGLWGIALAIGWGVITGMIAGASR